MPAIRSRLIKTCKVTTGACMFPTMAEAISWLEKIIASGVGEWVVTLSALCQCVNAFVLPLYPQVIIWHVSQVLQHSLAYFQ